MPANPSYFSALPLELLEQILSYSDELSIWRIRPLCRRLRDIGDVALEPYLARQVVVVDPPFATGLFEPFTLPNEDSDHLRSKALRSLHTSFQKHLENYPSAASRLRSLKLEIRDDDRINLCIRLLRSLPHQLESLELHVYDRLPLLCHRSIDIDRAASISQTEDDSMLTVVMWGGLLWPSHARFPNVTQLSLFCTARGLIHLAHLITHLPNLQSLAVINPDTSMYEFAVDDDAEENESYGSPTDLFRNARALTTLFQLTVSGEKWLVSDIAFRLVRHSHSLRRLVLHILDFTGGEGDYEQQWAIANGLSSNPSIQQLAIFGQSCEWIYHVNASYRNDFLPQLTTLLLEGSLVNVHWPLLDTQARNRPNLPRLQNITWVDPNCHKPFTTPGSTRGAENPYVKTRIRRLFDRYPSLRYIQWIDEHPKDPFAAGWADKVTRCRVYRPDENGHLEIVYQVGAIAEGLAM